MRKRYSIVLATTLATAGCRTPSDSAMATNPTGQPTLQEVYSVLRGKRFVDLTHAFAPGIPMRTDWSRRWPDARRPCRTRMPEVWPTTRAGAWRC